MAKSKRLDLILGAKDRASRPIGGVGQALSGLKSKMLALAAAATAAFTVKEVVAFGVTSAAQYEQAQVAFSTLLGSAEDAQKLLGELSDFAASTPFQLPGLTDASRSLVAFGVESQQVVPTLRRIGDVAAGIGQPIGEIAEIYGKARVQGRLFMEDINQLTGRGIPIIQELAQQFGVADSEVRKLVESGQINFGHLERAFVDLTSQGGKFSGMMAAQSQTLAGKWSTLKDNVQLALRDVSIRVIEAFGFKGGLDGLIAFTGRAKEALLEFTEFAIPKVKQFVGAVVGIARRVTDFLLPVMLARFGVIKQLVLTIIDVVRTAGAAIMDVIRSIFPSMGRAGEMATNLRDLITKALIVVEYGLKNWKQVVELTFLGASLQVVRFVNQVRHFFGEVIPSTLKWLGEEWHRILTMVISNTRTMFENMAGNAVDVLKNLPGLVAGTVKFSDLWTPISDGLRIELGKLPEIAARQEGELEGILRQQVEEISMGLAGGLGSFMQQRLSEINAQTSLFDGLFDFSDGRSVWRRFFESGKGQLNLASLVGGGAGDGLSIPLSIEKPPKGSAAEKEIKGIVQQQVTVDALQVSRRFLGLASLANSRAQRPQEETASNTSAISATLKKLLIVADKQLEAAKQPKAHGLGAGYRLPA